jgi:hypothetical protein
MAKEDLYLIVVVAAAILFTATFGWGAVGLSSKKEYFLSSNKYSQ